MVFPAFGYSGKQGGDTPAHRGEHLPRVADYGDAQSLDEIPGDHHAGDQEQNQTVLKCIGDCFRFEEVPAIRRHGNARQHQYPGQFGCHGEKHIDKSLKYIDFEAEQMPGVILDHDKQRCYDQDDEGIKNKAMKNSGKTRIADLFLKKDLAQENCQALSPVCQLSFFGPLSPEFDPLVTFPMRKSPARLQKVHTSPRRGKCSTSKAGLLQKVGASLLPRSISSISAKKLFNIALY